MSDFLDDSGGDFSGIDYIDPGVGDLSSEGDSQDTANDPFAGSDAEASGDTPTDDPFGGASADASGAPSPESDAESQARGASGGSSGSAGGGSRSGGGTSGSGRSSGFHQSPQPQTRQSAMGNPYGNLQPLPRPRALTGVYLPIGDRSYIPPLTDTYGPVYRNVDRGVPSAASRYRGAPAASARPNPATLAAVANTNAPTLILIAGIVAVVLIVGRMS